MIIEKSFKLVFRLKMYQLSMNVSMEQFWIITFLIFYSMSRQNSTPSQLHFRVTRVSYRCHYYAKMLNCVPKSRMLKQAFQNLLIPLSLRARHPTYSFSFTESGHYEVKQVCLNDSDFLDIFFFLSSHKCF